LLLSPSFVGCCVCCWLFFAFIARCCRLAIRFCLQQQ
jgi:cell division protein FtsW (lipid II flippase)